MTSKSKGKVNSASGTDTSAVAVPETPASTNTQNKPPRMGGILSNKPGKTVRNILLEVMPHFSAIYDDLQVVSKPIIELSKDATPAEQAQAGVQYLKALFDSALKTQYEHVISILAAVYEKSPDEIEDMPLYEIIGLAEELLNDPEIVRFFPQLHRLVPRTP